MAYIYLIRHAESAGNVGGLLQTTQEPLTKKGIEQAKWLGTQLPTFSIKKVFVSPMKRAVDTAQLAFKNTTTEIIPEPLLEEKRNGPWEGKAVASIDWTEINKQPFMTRHIPGGESLTDVQKRAKEFLTIIKNEKEPIAIVSHGTFLRVLVATMFGDDIEHVIRTRQFCNSSISTLK